MKNLLLLFTVILLFNCTTEQKQENARAFDELEPDSAKTTSFDTIIQEVNNTEVSITDTIAKTLKPSLKKARKKSANTIKIHGLDSVYAVLATKPEKFIINTEESSFIEGKKGTTIFFPKNAFGDRKKVIIKLKESKSKASYLFDCLSTQTMDGHQLETAGMIKIEAFDLNNQPIDLDKGKNLTIHFPKSTQNKDGFRIFNQSINKDSVVEWNENVDGIKDFYYRSMALNPRGEIWEFRFKKDTFPYLASKEKIYLQKILKDAVTNKIEFLLEVTGRNDSLFNFSERNNIGDNAFLMILKKVINHQTSPYINKLKPSDFPLKIYPMFSNGGIPFSNEEYKKKFIEKYGNGSEKKAQEFELRNYVLRTNQLGWINCDRFNNDDRPKVNINILANSTNEDYMLYFENFQSAIRAKKVNKRSVIKNIPKGARAILLGIKYENGKIFLGKKDLKVSTKPIEKIRFKEVAFENLSNRIQQLLN